MHITPPRGACFAPHCISLSQESLRYRRCRCNAPHALDRRLNDEDPSMNTKSGSMDLRGQPAVHAMQRASLGEPGRLVWDFLTLFAERRYAEANAYLAPGCRMLFPGGIGFVDCT